jgi:CDP-paratose 2-epimerase
LRFAVTLEAEGYQPLNNGLSPGSSAPGAGQFGTAERGIFSYWIHAWFSRQSLRYIGFNGSGHQVRDALHPADLALLVTQQLKATNRTERDRISNVSGGTQNSMSLTELSQ